MGDLDEEPCGPHQRHVGYLWRRPCSACGFCEVCCQWGRGFRLARLVTGYEQICVACGRLVTDETRRARDGEPDALRP